MAAYKDAFALVSPKKQDSRYAIILRWPSVSLDPLSHQRNTTTGAYLLSCFLDNDSIIILGWSSVLHVITNLIRTKPFFSLFTF